jgi:hypothetical protein
MPVTPAKKKQQNDHYLHFLCQNMASMNSLFLFKLVIYAISNQIEPIAYAIYSHLCHM